MTSQASTSISGRPIALTVLWIVLMAPLSLTGTALQPHTPVPYEVFPLVMAGPAIAALLCRLFVPRWFPAASTPVPARRFSTALGATVLAGIAFTVVCAVLMAGGPAALPVGWGRAAGIIGVVVGLAAGSLLEEIGYRGIMYRALSSRLRPPVAILINGAFFGLCHLQYFGAGQLAVALFVLSAVFMDVVMVALWTGSWVQRVGIVTLFHAVVNIALALIGDPQTSLRSFAVLALATGVAAVIAVPLGRAVGLGDLGGSRKPRAPKT